MNEPRAIFLATKNAKKIKELQSILGNCWEVKSTKDLPKPVAWDETGSTFEENARIKVEALAEQTNEIILGDDSGLAVDALNGSPGVFSSRYAGRDGDDKANNNKLLQEMITVEDHLRTARFVCCLCFLDDNREFHYFTGTCEGKIGRERKGSEGFGYDPIFYPQGDSRSLAEYSATEKNTMSHRAKALEQFLSFVSH